MRTTKLAGVMPVQNYDNTLGTFYMLEAMSDWTCVLDDNSHRPFQFADDADEYLSLRRGTLYNDVGNRTMLMYRAYLAGYHWALVMDGDMLPSRALFDWIRCLDLGACSNTDLCVPLRDLWNSGNCYRTDGPWAHKKWNLLQANPFFSLDFHVRNRELRLHASISQNKAIMADCPAGCCIYHFGSRTPELRNARVELYRKQDGKNEFQADYTYLADETGLTLANLPEEDASFIHDWIVHRRLPIQALTTAPC